MSKLPKYYSWFAKINPMTICSMIPLILSWVTRNGMKFSNKSAVATTRMCFKGWT